jgi:4-amino-4-deoxy-L-arabinose transferase
MIEYLPGTGILVVTALLLFYAFRHYRSGRIQASLALILFAGLLLRLFVSADFYLHEWDERYHALVAKNMMEHPFKPLLYVEPLLPYDFKDWTSNHVWVHKQPFPLWAMAGSMHLFGVNEIALRIPSILLSTAAVYLTFLIGSYFFGKTAGLWAAFFHSINGLIIELTGGRVATDHYDTIFLFFIELAILFSLLLVKKDRLAYALLAGLSMGIAILTKWLPALIVVPVWLACSLGREKPEWKKLTWQLAVMLLAAVAVALPWQFYIHAQFPQEAQWESDYNWRHFTEVIEGHEESFLKHFGNMPRIWGELIYLPVLWFFYSLAKRWDWNKAALAIWVFVPFLFFSFARTKMQAYTLFTCPALFIMLAWHCRSLHLHELFYLKKRWLSRFILLLLVVLPLRYCYERVKPFKTDRNPAWASELRSLAQKYEGKKVVIFNMERPVEAMFYGDFTAYFSAPDSQEIKPLLQKGYLVMLKKGNGLDEHTYSVEGVKFLE